MGASKVAELTAAEVAAAEAMAAASPETADAGNMNETTGLLVKGSEQPFKGGEQPVKGVQRLVKGVEQPVALQHGVVKQASHVGAQLQTVGRAAAKTAGRSVLCCAVHPQQCSVTISWKNQICF